MSEKNLHKVMVKTMSGEKLSVPRLETINLYDKRNVQVTKISPFNSLLTHCFVQKGETAKNIAKEYNIMIPELPDEAHSTWKKDIWLIVETCKQGALACRLAHDFGEEKQFFNVYENEESGKERECTRIRFTLLFESRVFISENYENALPIVTSYRKCPFCSSPGCIIEQGSGIQSYCDKELERYEKNYSIEYNVCEKYKRGFITVLQKKNIQERSRIACRFCGSQSAMKIKPEDNHELLSMSRMQEKILAKDFKLSEKSKKQNNKMRKAVKEFHELLADNPDLFNNLYECKQCFSVFDNSGKVLLRPYKLDL